MIPYIKYDADPTLYNVYNTTITRTLDGINHLKCKSTQAFDLDDDVQIVSVGGDNVQISMGIDILDKTSINISASESYIPIVGTPITFVNTGGSLPSPYVYGTTYYIRKLSLICGTYFGNLSATLGGPAITAASGGTFTIQFYEDNVTTTLFDGIITGKKIEMDNEIYEYEIAEQAYELTYSLVNNNGNYFVKLSSQTVNDIIDNYILDGTGWIRGSSDTTIIPLISFYYSNRLNSLYKVIEMSKSIGTYTDVYIWFDVDTKTVYFDSSRNTNTEPSIVINKTVEESSAKRNIDYVIVLGNTDNIIAQYPTTPAGTKAAIYRYSDATASSECLPIATSLYEELKNPRLIITYEIPTSYDYFEGDIVTVDTTDYIVQEVVITPSKTKITLNDTRQTIQDILNDSLKEVTGEIATGSTATYDGGLQNIGAPQTNELVTCDYQSKILYGATYPTVSVNDEIKFTGTSTYTLPSPLNTSTTYYVIKVDDDGFWISTSPYGSSVVITTAGSGTIKYYKTAAPSTYYPFSIAYAFVYNNIPDVFYNGRIVRVSVAGGTLPGGLRAATNYYIVDSTLLGCKLATTLGGSPIDITSAGSGTFTMTDADEPDVNTTFTVDINFNTLIFANDAAAYNDGDKVFITSTGALPSPLITNTEYYIVYADENGFKVSETSGGSPVALTTNGSGFIRVRNLSSASVPAIYYINIQDVGKIDDFDLKMDFDYFKENLSVGETVEFLSAVNPFVNSDSIVNGVLSGFAGYTLSFEIECDKMDTGFSWGIVSISGLIGAYGAGGSYSGTLDVYIDYGDGEWISSNQSLNINTGYLDHGSSVYKCPISWVCYLNGSNLPEYNNGDVKIKLVFTRTGGTTGANIQLNSHVSVMRFPRHTHVINSAYNVSGSIYPYNVIVKLTNADYTDETIATYSGSLAPPSSEKTLDITPYLATGGNKLMFFSDLPGSLYLSGSYNNYG